jgi:hypothetical protein
MARETLVGYYGKLAIAVDTPIITGTLIADTKYIATTIGGSSTLPTGVEAGYAFVADGTEDITSSGDEVLQLIETDKCDIQSWGIEFSDAEIDVTTLCNDQNVYLGGRTDASGTMEGVYKIGQTDADGGFGNTFFDIVRQADAGGTVTIDKIDKNQIVLMLYKQKDTTSGETEQLYITPATILTFSDGVAGSDAQSFSSSFRIAPNDDIKFQLLSVAIA